MDLQAAIRITADLSTYLRGLAEARAASLRTFRDMRGAVDPARQAWQAAQEEVRALAQAMGQMGPPSEAQRAAFAAATASASALKAKYIELRDAVHAQRAALADNATAIAQARSAHEQAAASASRQQVATKALATETDTLATRMRDMAMAAAGAFGVGSAGQLLAMVDQYGQLVSRIKLVSGSYAEQSQAQRDVQRTAMDNGVAIMGVGQFYTRTAQAVRAYKLEQSQAMAVTDLAGKALRIGGGTTQGNTAALEQLVQALGSGKLQGDELKSLAEQAPRLAQAIADGLGVPIGKLKELGSEGALSSQMVMQAILSQADVINEEAARIPLTLSQSVTVAQNKLQVYSGSVDQATGVTRSLGDGLRVLAANMDVVAPVATGTAVALGALGATGAVRVLAGLALGAGPVALGLAAVAGVATAAWMALSGGEAATASTRKGLAALNDEVRQFGGNWEEAQRNAKIAQLTKGIDEARAALGGLSKLDATTVVGDMYRQQIAEAEKLRANLQSKNKAADTRPLLLEKMQLGLTDTGVAQGALIDKKNADAINAFEALYKAFVAGKVGDDKKLIASQAEVRRALGNLAGMNKTPEELNALVQALEKASTAGDSAYLTNAIGNAMEARRAAESKALESQVTGLRARAQEAQAMFTSMAEQARIAAGLATAADRVRAELGGDTGAVSADQAARARAEVAAAQAAARAQMSAVEQVYNRKMELIATDRVASNRAYTAEIDENKRLLDLVIAKRAEIAKAPASEAGQARDAKLAEEQEKLKKAGEELLKKSDSAIVSDILTANRRVVEVERETARERLGILRGLQQEMVKGATEALNNYKSYAQQVIALDRQIASGRLDAENSINSIKRRDMNPAQQAESLRAELAGVQAATDQARRAGDRQLQQDLLGRQRGLAGELAGLQGEGLDTKALRAEAIDNLQRIGDESDALLRAQRDEAAAAAQQQMAMFEALATAAKEISVEIGKINQGEAIHLKAVVDTESVSNAVEEVRAAFASQTFAIKIAAQPVPMGDVPTPVSRAAGGAIFGPGSGTSDSVPAWLSNGEHVLTAAEVASAGGHGAIYALRAALKRGIVPRFAEGGAVGRLAVPEMARAPAETPLQPMNVTIPGLGTVPMMAAPNEAERMDAWARAQALKYGRAR